MRRASLVFPALLVAGCSRCSSGGAGMGGSATDDAATRSADAATATATADASTTAPKPTLENLLYATDAVVAVSSKVDNPKDFPEHLVDGKAETAWNGRTGDLVGGWMDFRVPAAAHVTAITLSCGFDKKTASGDDLFTMNHRIDRIKLMRDHALVRDVTLDVNVRTPQRLEIDADGGDFRIQVMSTVPGTKDAWRELTVSELAVWGQPNGARLPKSQLPRVNVGSLDADSRDAASTNRVEEVRGPFASFDAFCTEHEALMKPRFEDGKHEFPGFIEPPYCQVHEHALVTSPAAPILDVRAIKVTEWDERIDYVAIRTARGVFVTTARIDAADLRNPSCGGSCTHAMKSADTERTSKGSAFVLVAHEHCWFNPFPASSPDEHFDGSSIYTRTATVCMVVPGGDPHCTAYQAGKAETSYRLFDDDFDAVRWKSVKRRKTTPDGDVIFQ